MKRTILLIIGFILLGAAGFLAWNNYGPGKKSPQNQPSSNNQTAQAPGSIRLIATGDFIAHDSVNQEAKTDGGGYNYLKMMQNLKPFFEKSDVKFCNQPTPAGGEINGVSGFPTFNAPTEFSRDMAVLGCNLINTGSNHTFDKGQSVINDWLKYWDNETNILAVGGANRSAEEQAKIRTFEVKGKKFAFLSYTTYTNSKPANKFGVNFYSRKFAKAQLTEAKKTADFIIVSMRWGDEGKTAPNAFQQEEAQFLADNGATIILGHGPHVLQPVKKLTGAGGKDAVVWFSLGNFLNTQLQVNNLFSCIAVIDIDTSSGAIKNIACLPIYMHYEWTAAEKKAEDLLKRHNLGLYTLDTAAEALAKSQNGTTVEQQRTRITNLLNQFTTVKILRDTEF